MKTNNITAMLSFLVIILTQAVFLILKSLSVIQWSWLWVFAPLWIPYVTLIILGVLLVLLILIPTIKERIFKDE